MEKNKVEYRLATAMGKLFCKLPLNVSLSLGKGIGLLCYYFIPIRKKVAIANVQSAFPEKSSRQVKKIVRNTYIHFALNIVEFMRYPVSPPAFIKQHVKFVNPELLDEAAAGGKGAILMSGHFGNWEIMGAAICGRGHPIVGAVKEQRNNLVGELINEYRLMVGIEPLTIGMGIRGVLKSLHNNKFVVLVADQDAHETGVFVDFLGRPSSTAPGPATMALKTGAPIIFGTCVRNPKGHHTVYLARIDHGDLDGVTPENIKILTQRHATKLENSIMKNPDHWLWMHKRWKTNPPVMQSAETETSS